MARPTQRHELFYQRKGEENTSDRDNIRWFINRADQLDDLQKPGDFKMHGPLWSRQMRLARRVQVFDILAKEVRDDDADSVRF